MHQFISALLQDPSIDRMTQHIQQAVLAGNLEACQQCLAEDKAIFAVKNLDCKVLLAKTYNNKRIPHEKRLSIFRLLIQAGLEYGPFLTNRINPTSELAFLIEAGADPNHAAPDGATGLTSWAAYGNKDTAQRLRLFLTKENINKQLDDEYQNTPLHILIANENRVGAIALIDAAAEKKITINYHVADSGGKTPLILAAKTRAGSMVVRLLEEKRQGANVDIDARDHQGRTAFHYACVLGDGESVRALVDAGVDCMQRDNAGRTGFDYANCLAEITTEKTIADILNSVSIDPERDERAQFNEIKGCFHYQPPVIITASGKTEIVEVKARVSSKNDIKKLCKTPMLSEIQLSQIINRMWQSAKHPAMADDYYEMFFNQRHKDTILNEFNQYTGRTIAQKCLHELSQVKEVMAAQTQALDLGVELRYAVHFNDKEKVIGLLARPDIGSFIDSIGKDSGKTALHRAASKGFDELCLRLVKQGADVSLQESAGNTPLHLACQQGQFKAALMMLTQPINDTLKSCTNHKGQTIHDILLLQQAQITAQPSNKTVSLLDKLLEKTAPPSQRSASVDISSNTSEEVTEAMSRHHM